MNVFIDTNVFLSFYHYSSDDLEELRKLIFSSNEGAITLWLPEQVKTEFRRNREKKVSESLKVLEKQKLNLQFPQICKDYDEYDQLRDLQRQYATKRATLLERIESDARDKTLRADGRWPGFHLGSFRLPL